MGHPTDHKKIGILYLVATFLFFILGSVEALMMRLQLRRGPEHDHGRLDLQRARLVARLDDGLPDARPGLGRLRQLPRSAHDRGARPFPRLNALSFWLLLFGGIVFYVSLFFSPPEAGWTSYAPLSDAAFLPGGGIDAWILMIHLTGLSSILGARSGSMRMGSARSQVRISAPSPRGRRPPRKLATESRFCSFVTLRVRNTS